MQITNFASISVAQRFLTPVNRAAKYGNLSGSVDFVWTYSTPDVSRTSITCAVRLENIIFKRAGGRAAIQGGFAGRATAIDDTSRSVYRIGFRLNTLAFSDASNYHCSMRYAGGPPIRSKEYTFRIYGNHSLLTTLIFILIFLIVVQVQEL